MSADSLPAKLRRALVRLARTPRLLVACDYDGTLAPIVEDPDQALPRPESVTALRALASLAATTVAVISGRALRDLATLSRLPAEVHLVGSHGSEFDEGFVHALEPAQRALHEELHTELERLVVDAKGVSIEAKPASIAVHVRRAEPETGERVLSAVRAGPCTWDRVQVTEGKSVIELAVVQTDKGQALDLLRHQVGASAVVFLGDDVTDEKAFARLTGPDVGVKIGAGETLADYRVQSPEDITTTLALLAEERRGWLHGEAAVPI